MRKSVGHLSKGVAIYGAGDAAIQAVSFLLLPVYVKFDFLRDEDYGAIGLIIAVEMIAKVVSRWGLDGSFMRLYHDRPAGGPLEQLSSSIIWFTMAANIVVFGAALAVSGWFGASLFPVRLDRLGFQLMLVNTLSISLTYIPFHLMRLRGEAVTFSAINLARSAGTVLARAAFVMGLGWGVAGWFAADLAVTVLVWPVLWRWMRPLVRFAVSRQELGVALRFGLPRVPHGLAQQGLDAGNKLLLNAYIPRPQLGVYQVGFTLGTAIRFFTSAFETAWAPFYYETSRQTDARVVYAKVTTYGVAVLAVLAAVTIGVARDVVLVMLTPDYLGAVHVLPIVAVGMALQGVYLLTSIGLNLTSQTRYYPMATGAALAVGLTSGVLLMPPFGMVGAAVAFLASTLTQTIVAFVFARRVYPIAYEAGRLVRVLAAATAAAMAGAWLLPDLSPLPGLFIRPLITLMVFALLLVAAGFFRNTERAFLAEISARLRRRADRAASQDGRA